MFVLPLVLHRVPLWGSDNCVCISININGSWERFISCAAFFCFSGSNTKLNPPNDKMLLWPYFKEGIIFLGLIIMVSNSCLNDVNWKHSLLICSQSQDRSWVIKEYLSANITAEDTSSFSEPMWKHWHVQGARIPLCVNVLGFLHLYCGVLSFSLSSLVILVKHHSPVSFKKYKFPFKGTSKSDRNSSLYWKNQNDSSEQGLNSGFGW